MMIPKRTRFVSETLRKASHGKRCVLCEVGISMPCHLPHAAIGMAAGTGQKTHDWLVADCCDECHYKLDHGEWRNDHQVRHKAHALTLQRRFDEGVLLVAGEDHTAPEHCLDLAF